MTGINKGVDMVLDHVERWQEKGWGPICEAVAVQFFLVC